MQAVLIIPGEMIDLNTYVAANRTSKFAGAAIKQTETERVAWECKAQRMPHFAHKVTAHYKIYTKNDRKDEDNLLIYIKWINDGLVHARVIKDDGTKQLHIGSITIQTEGKTRTEVTLIQTEV